MTSYISAGQNASQRPEKSVNVNLIAPDVLFLKRLLYLKASIDNEQTLNTYTVPFQEEKQRDQASPDQLMLNTAAITSERDSDNPWSPKAINA